MGGGGREHALAWKLAQSPSLTTLYAAPGNPGIAQHARTVPLDIDDHAAVGAFCRAHAVSLVVIGPEAPLVAGLADALRRDGVAVFGPSAAAARLEGSKGFAKDLCQRSGIPTARYVRTASLEEARRAVLAFQAPFVLKADGLAAGKGVVIAETLAEAELALADLFAGPGGAEVVIEEYLHGEEVSVFALTDGTRILPFGSAQDHKRVGDGDTGPNTGGMGAYAPAPVLTPELCERVYSQIIAPTVDTLRADGNPYVGALYAGVMLTASGPRLIEYNCRFGDPECQVLMMLYRGDLAALLLRCAQGELDDAPAPDAHFASRSALTVVVAAKGYPGQPRLGGRVELGGAEDGGAVVFQAGTRREGDHLVASGGRVLAVTATGDTLPEARDAAYRAVERIGFADGFWRRDIGWRELRRAALRSR